jgi:hypothetical protein
MVLERPPGFLSSQLLSSSLINLQYFGQALHPLHNNSNLLQSRHSVLLSCGQRVYAHRSFFGFNTGDLAWTWSLVEAACDINYDTEDHRDGSLASSNSAGSPATSLETFAKGRPSLRPTQRSATVTGSRRMSASKAGFIDATRPPAQRLLVQLLLHSASPNFTHAAFVDRTVCTAQLQRTGHCFAGHEYLTHTGMFCSCT